MTTDDARSAEWERRGAAIDAALDRAARTIEANAKVLARLAEQRRERRTTGQDEDHGTP